MLETNGKAKSQCWKLPARETLPGNVRQRVRRVLHELRDQPRPGQSRALDVTDLDVPANIEIRRIRLEHWRIIYALNDIEKWVWVLAIRQRPPYDYEDISELVLKLGE